MIYIVTAMYAEARPIIARLGLKKELSWPRFQVFLNRESGICLVISGTGMVPAAVAVSSICTSYGAGHAREADFLVNVGVCGQIPYNGQRACQKGRLFLCSKIREQTTGRTFYPDLLYRHPFGEAVVVTGARPYEKTDLPGREEADFILYDMEASSVYQAGACFLGPHQMSFLKVVSDDGNAGNVTPGEIEDLISKNTDALAGYIETLQAICRDGRRDPFSETALQEEWDRLCLDMHCSRTMSESVRQHLRYCVLAGVDYASVLTEMYRRGRLPCRDKREGKQCLDELRKQLL